MREGGATRERILAEALAEFARRGFAGARMEAIAVAVGINKASLYFHFASKEALFRELFQGVVGRYRAFLERITGAGADLPARRRLAALHRAYLEDAWRNPEMDFWNRIYYFPPEALADEIRRTTLAVETEFLGELTAVFAEGIRRGDLRPGDPAAMAKTYYYLITCLALCADLFDLEKGLAEMDECFAVFWEGIRK